MLNVPYNIGRLPSNKKERNSLSGLTAEQMKNFAIVYVRACLLKGLISDTFSKVSCLLCNMTIIWLTEDNLTCLYRLLHERLQSTLWKGLSYSELPHGLAYARHNFGPPHAFWCFTYEQMNGILNGILALTPPNKRYRKRGSQSIKFNLSSYKPVLKELIEPQKHHHSLRLNGHYLCFMLIQKDWNAANSR